MAIRFIIGRSGTGKTYQCLQEIRERVIAEPDGTPLIYLVPEQMTFQSEYELVKTREIDGIIRAQVYSFTRLALRVLQETGGITRHHISRTGINMLLRKIVERNSDSLKVFQIASQQNGFYSLLEEMMTEFKRYCVTLEELQVNREQLLKENKALEEKISDLQLIYQELSKELVNKYVDSEDYLQLFTKKIKQSSYLKNAEIWIDGFHSFTPQELHALIQLAEHCPKLTITLTVDKAYDDFSPHELDLFRTTATTYQTIKKLAAEHQVTIQETVVLDSPKRFVNASAIQYLENNYNKRPVIPYEGSDSVVISGAVNRRVEVETVARDIMQLVKNQKYRFHDIAILLRNPNDYTDLLKTILQDHAIPFFQDQKRSMLHHPLIEFIRSSLDVIKQNWRYDAVFRCVKTDLLQPLDDNRSRKIIREQMDLLENYVLAYGIKGEKWKEQAPWHYRKYHSLDTTFGAQTDEEKKMETLLYDLREMISSPIKRLERDFAEAKTAKDFCRTLYEYLERLDIPTKIERWRDEAEENGELTIAREHDQVWRSVVNLLDETVEILGNESITLELFSNVIETGFESLRFSLVPPAIDQVLIASIDRSRFFNVKCTFIIGANDGILPAKPTEEGILTDDERIGLMKCGIELAPTSMDKLLDEQFLIYMALSSSSDKLFISYPLADEEGKSLLPSILINQMNEMLPYCEQRFLTQGLEDFKGDTKELLYYLTSPKQALSLLSVELRQWKKGYSIHPIWWDVYNWFQSHDEWKLQAQRIISSLFYTNRENPLPKKISEELYGTKIQTSVSRMEKQSACAFSQFASYGLKLQERQLFRLEAPDIGQLFHAALRDVAAYLRMRKIDWKELTRQDCYRIAEEMVARLAPKLQSQILLSSNRHHYIQRKLSQVVGRASFALSEQAKISGFSPIGLELGFGSNGTLPPLRYELDNGFKMELVGRIDRVDAADSTNGLLLRIIDYKSSQKDLNLVELYYGIALQMLTYLEVIISYSEKWLGTKAKPAGVLYFHVHDPIHSAKQLLTVEEIEQELFKKFKMKGLLLADEESARLMDTKFEKKSEVIPLELKKAGGFTKNSAVIEEDKLNLTRSFVRNKIKDIGMDITNGMIDISPYQFKSKTPCTYCEFKSLCQFDESLAENNYRILRQEDDETLFERMGKKGGQQHE